MTTTTSVFEEVRDEHRHLRPHVEGLRLAADALQGAAGRDAFELVDESWRFLSEHLLPHARAEEHSIYRAFTDAAKSKLPSRLLTMDHEAIGALVEELGALRRAAADHETLPEDVARSLRRVLYGLHALVGGHFEKEEAVVLPTLEQVLTPAEAEEVVHLMHRSH